MTTKVQSWALSVCLNLFNNKNDFFAFFIKLITISAQVLFKKPLPVKCIDMHRYGRHADRRCGQSAVVSPAAPCSAYRWFTANRAGKSNYWPQSQVWCNQQLDMSWINNNRYPHQQGQRTYNGCNHHSPIDMCAQTDTLYTVHTHVHTCAYSRCTHSTAHINVRTVVWTHAHVKLFIIGSWCVLLLSAVLSVPFWNRLRIWWW